MLNQIRQMLLARGSAMGPQEDGTFTRKKLTISNLNNANIDFLERSQKERESSLNIQGLHKKSEVRRNERLERNRSNKETQLVLSSMRSVSDLS